MAVKKTLKTWAVEELVIWLVVGLAMLVLTSFISLDYAPAPNPLMYGDEECSGTDLTNSALRNFSMEACQDGKQPR